MWQSNAMIVLGAWLIVALLGLTVLFAEWRAVRQLRWNQRETERLLSLLYQQTESAVTMSVRVGRRLRRAEKQLARTSERLGQLELRVEGRSYDQAITLARRGADANRLMSNLGLSRGEADLVALLHRERKVG
jgi:biopolymer transport protein ExbB/TolQ